MNSIIKEIGVCPPADRLRMILAVFGAQCDFVGVDQLLTIGFAAVRTLEQSPSMVAMETKDKYVPPVDRVDMLDSSDDDDADSDCPCPGCTGDRLRCGTVSGTSSSVNTLNDLKTFFNQRLDSVPSPQELPRSMMDAVNWTDLLDQTPSVGQQDTTPVQDCPSPTYKF